MEIAQNETIEIRAESEKNILESVVSDHPRWIKDVCHEKVRLVMLVIHFSLETSSAEETLKLTEGRNAGLTDQIQEIKNEIVDILKDVKSEMDTTENILEFVERLNESVTLMEVYIQSHMKLKVEHSRKIFTNLARKVRELLASKGDILSAHEEQMAAKNAEVDSIQTDIERLIRERQNILSKINFVSEETSVERQRLEELKIKLREVDSIREQIKSCDRLSAHLASVREANIEATNELSLTITALENEIELLMQAHDVMEQDQRSVANYQNNLEVVLREIVQLMDLVQCNVAFSVFESNEIYQREVMTTDYFKQLKSCLEQKQSDNMSINKDVQEKYCAIEAQALVCEELQKQLEEITDLLQEVHTNIDDINHSIDSTQKLLDDRLKDAQKVNEALKKEIAELEVDVSKAEDELDRIAKGHEQAITNLNLKLKAEQAKTQRAREQHKAISDATFTKTLSQQKENEIHRNFLSQKSSPTLKRQHSAFRSSSQQITGSNSSPRLTMPTLHESEPYTPPKQQKISGENSIEKFFLKTNIPVLKKTLPILTEKPSINIQTEIPKNMPILVEKPSTAVAKSPVLVKSPIEKKTDPVANYDRIVLKEHSSFQLKNLVSTKNLVEVKKTSFVHAFDSDDESSFNVTFNTDVEDFLE